MYKILAEFDKGVGLSISWEGKKPSRFLMTGELGGKKLGKWGGGWGGLL